MDAIIDRLARQMAEKRAYGNGWGGGYGGGFRGGRMFMRGPGGMYSGMDPAQRMGMTNQMFQPQYQDVGSGYEQSEVNAGRGAMDASNRNMFGIDDRRLELAKQKSDLASRALQAEGEMNNSSFAKGLNMVGLGDWSPVNTNYAKLESELRNFDAAHKGESDIYAQQQARTQKQYDQSQSDIAQNSQLTHEQSRGQLEQQNRDRNQSFSNQQSALGRMGVHGGQTPQTPSTMQTPAYQSPMAGQAAPPPAGQSPVPKPMPKPLGGAGGGLGAPAIGGGPPGMAKGASWMNKVAFLAAKRLLSK